MISRSQEVARADQCGLFWDLSIFLCLGKIGRTMLLRLYKGKEKAPGLKPGRY